MNDLDKIVPVLAKSRHTIASLELVNESDPIEWNRLSRLPFPRLKRLTLHNLKMDEIEWIALLAGCQNIESLELTLQTVHMDRMTEAISSLKYLKYLYIAQDTGDAAFWSNARMLSSNTSLQRLRLIGVPMEDTVLLALCEMPTLKDLSLSEQPYTSTIGLDGLLAFADKLKESCIETLGLIYFECLEDKVLERLAHVNSLSMLTILFSPRITDAGVKSFTRGGATAKKIDVQYCQSVSRRGLWAEEFC
ncbi:hypothetical protein BJV82DRAFT_581996 [Fennellomyces sp. T-0311]|nr:hypothetical protein BJV82DRAFT_581996 [Fennellomyces sp. T-0311]